MPLLKPKYNPHLSGEELQKAQKTLRKHRAAQSEAQRARLAVLLGKEPVLPNWELARRLGRTRMWVQKWRKRWAQQGFSLEDEPRSGRPKVFSPTTHHRGQKYCLRTAGAAS